MITEEKAADLLPVSIIYGSNGGGKSSLLQTLSCVISTIVKPVNELEKNRQHLILQQKVNAVPFFFDKTSANGLTEFRMIFRISKNEYCYYIAIKNDEIISESLYRKQVVGKKSATLFERETDSITLGPSINKKSINTSVNPKMPYLSFLTKNYDIPVIGEVMTWFERCIIRSYANPMYCCLRQAVSGGTLWSRPYLSNMLREWIKNVLECISNHIFFFDYETKFYKKD